MQGIYGLEATSCIPYHRARAASSTYCVRLCLSCPCAQGVASAWLLFFSLHPLFLVSSLSCLTSASFLRLPCCCVLVAACQCRCHLRDRAGSLYRSGLTLLLLPRSASRSLFVRSFCCHSWLRSMPCSLWPLCMPGLLAFEALRQASWRPRTALRACAGRAGLAAGPCGCTHASGAGAGCPTACWPSGCCGCPPSPPGSTRSTLFQHCR